MVTCRYRRNLFRWVVAAVAGVLVVACSPAAPAAKPVAQEPGTLADIIRKAAEEREIVLQIQDPLQMSPAEAGRLMSAGLKRTFGIDITVKPDGSLSYNAAVAKVIAEIKSGNPPSYDLLYQDSVTAVPLFQEKVIEGFDWTKLVSGITNDDLIFDGLAIIPGTALNVPAYNTTLVRGADIPQSWDDVVNPRWKGRLGTTVYQDPWTRLAEPKAWGEERTTEYLRRMAALEPKLGRYAEIHQRLVSGEVAIAAQDYVDWVDADKQRGAPVELAPVEPVLATLKVTLVAKGARHANAAALLSAWFLTEEGQRFMDDAYTAASLFKPGTMAARFIEGKKYVVPTTDFQMANSVRLSKEWEEILVKK